jgi:DNA-binding NarL/FixJ family response regulator
VPDKREIPRLQKSKKKATLQGRENSAGGSNMKINIGIADDQQLFLKSLSTLIDTFPQFTVVLEAMNGEDLLRKMAATPTKPDIQLIDVNMPVMDGVRAAKAIGQQFPTVKMVALSMKDDDMTILSMIKAGCCAFLLKDIHPDELEKGLLEINAKGFYNADACNVNYRRLILHSRQEEALTLTDRERNFLQLACSDFTYKQIAAEMHLSERTIDGYREAIFEKFNVQSRVGMVLEGLRRTIVTIPNT